MPQTSYDHSEDRFLTMALRHAMLVLCLVGICRGTLCLSKSNPRIQLQSERNGSHRQRDRDSVNYSTERTVVLLYHKPPKLITSHKSDDLVQASYLNPDEHARETVYSDIQKMTGYVGTAVDDCQPLPFLQATGIRSKVHAIGRLDADTTGLLLLTNDGALIHHVTNRNAATHDAELGAITKTYEALIMGYHDDESLERVRKGVDIGFKYGGMTKPVQDLCILDHPNHKSTLVSLTISEGRNRQVRRMFHAIQSGVMNLKRTKIGDDLTLGDLEEGQWRLLTDEEVEKSLHWKPRSLVDTSRFQLPRKKIPNHANAEELQRQDHGKSKRQKRRWGR
jgi:pseudouridine synthase